MKIVDVRPAHHFKVSHLRGVVNWPLEEMQQILDSGSGFEEKAREMNVGDENILVVCRRGVDSKTACRVLVW